MKCIKVAHLIFIIIGLMSCSEREGLAPVVEVKWRDANLHARQHRVERGETLYAIAFRYDQDYQQLARINHLMAPYTLRVGQVIQLKSHESMIPMPEPLPQRPARYTQQARPKPYYPQPHAQPRIPVQPRFYSNGSWTWPIAGKVIQGYMPDKGKKGLDISGKKGEKVYAARGGVVAYSGNGLAGYGNLIIIKHDNQFLTAYGDNLRNLVKEGQVVKQGQIIADIGIVNHRFWGVHFEIRKMGRPVNPMNYLK